MTSSDKPLVWLRGEVKAPPLLRDRSGRSWALASPATTRREAPAPALATDAELGSRCHELRIVDEIATWRIIYRLDTDAVVIAEVFSKKTPQTPGHVIEDCQRHLRRYDKEAR